MDQAVVKSLREKLEQAREQLGRRVARKTSEGREVTPDVPVDAAEQALMSYTKELVFSQGQNETQVLQMVTAALRRLDEGTYGVCRSCGREIGSKRLDAMPWTDLCIECQALLEEVGEGNRGAA